jgi:hypothetical protein
MTLLPDDLDEHALGPVAVELAVEDLLPRTHSETGSGRGACLSAVTAAAWAIT